VDSDTSNGVTSPIPDNVPVAVVEMRLTAGGTLTQDLPDSYFTPLKPLKTSDAPHRTPVRGTFIRHVIPMEEN
jgi:hypothetical protein